MREPRDPVHRGNAQAGEKALLDAMKVEDEDGAERMGAVVGSPPGAAVLASANRTGANQSAAQTVPQANPPFRMLNVLLNLTALAGGTTPTVTAKVQWSDDSTTWYDVDGNTDTFTALSAVGSVVKSVTIKAPYWRLVTGTTGTPTTATYGATARYLP